MQRVKYEKGLTLIELTVVLLVTSILAGMSISGLRQIYHPSTGGAESLVSFLKSARSKALATTSTYTIVPVSTTRIKTTVSTACSSEDQEDDDDLILDLPTGTALTDTDWSICYTSRGTSNSSASLFISDTTATKEVQVVLGGGVRIL